jgi:solute carrier family 36 (proton-coupled amino acid transporter)
MAVMCCLKTRLVTWYNSDYEFDESPTTEDIEANSEQAPLLPRSVSRAASSRIKGTSDSKAFFMLTKAFVGTGVLFLPNAFRDGGMGFSILLLVFIAAMTLHCMLLLAETSQKLEGKSFGDLGMNDLI